MIDWDLRNPVEISPEEEQIEILQAKLKIAVDALSRIREPNYQGVDGMIIADMGFNHFAKYVAIFAMEEIKK